jgi:hypothetical protein
MFRVLDKKARALTIHFVKPLDLDLLATVLQRVSGFIENRKTCSAALPPAHRQR